VFQQTCTINPGGSMCSTPPLAPNCGAGIATARAYKYGTGNNGWEAVNLTGVMC
jgi:hypothetical protein